MIGKIRFDRLSQDPKYTKDPFPQPNPICNQPTQPPLSLYIHIPWCVQKCPYCDFNSHRAKQEIPQSDYVRSLIEDLDQDRGRYLNQDRRPLSTIFIGGGTPSLFDPKLVGSLLTQVKSRFDLVEESEITLESNPGTIEIGRYEGFKAAGVNRISIGVQSFQDSQLVQLGRVHDSRQAVFALGQAQRQGFKSYNIDLMHSLPNQTIEESLADLNRAVKLGPPHLSWYELTIEPKTEFYKRPPEGLPNEDL